MRGHEHGNARPLGFRSPTLPDLLPACAGLRPSVLQLLRIDFVKPAIPQMLLGNRNLVVPAWVAP